MARADMDPEDTARADMVPVDGVVLADTECYRSDMDPEGTVQGVAGADIPPCDILSATVVGVMDPEVMDTARAVMVPVATAV